ncbi:putative transcription-associated protein [Clavispora lusitaniae]|uniref:Transcription-associated protein n=1 Tax=Clavispora lusitaniae TaxID=36911 RepID=A0ACD0WTC7_CLALS|nr:putative transcription-associated protein [Clavispora lusitaniae]QFZ36150.1 putative transcription-associated protein [Clavispora lusitaniae]QFZ41834.1 putative transcription-associated protein [Clavispora lusitaniae]QFZ47510.1 putative transcription-associated protein [Clavispora lusitaniae]QFZ53189.1 putative transcription-associated protein [Clavispora lusitaniae]
MNYVEQLDTFVQRLRDAENDYKESQSVLSELLDMIEAFNGAAEYEYFLKNLVPVFLSKLETVPISFSSSSPEHKLRNSVLEIIHRSIMTETFQPYSESILVCLTKVLENENEDNGVLCMKIITSLHKAYKTTLADKVEPFVSLINRVYDNMDEAVERVFSSQPSVEDAEEEAKASSAPGSLEKDKSKTLAKAMMSFKTLAECPITMVSLYSSYKSLVQTSLPVFLPKIIHILLLQVPQQKQFRKELLKSASSVTAISPQITNRQAYSDFILGQVKAASFLAYVFIRGYASQHLPAAQANVVPDVILRLLQDCPAELSVARKELLHATRHILSTPFRSHFVPKIEFLFDEKILIGHGLTSFETLRPLAYSTVADFIHNVRNELTPKQIWSTVQIYCDLLKDDSLALTVQIMSAKLLLNLVERIMKLPNKLEGRQLFMIIIDSYAKRFHSLNRKYPYILRRHIEFEEKRKFKESDSKLAIERYRSKAVEIPNGTLWDDKKEDDSKMDVDSEKSPSPEKDDIDIFGVEELSPISVTSPSTNSDLLKDARYLFRTLMTFLKSVIFGLKSCNPPVPPQPVQQDPNNPGQLVNYDKWNDSAKLTSLEEINILRSLFRGGISCLKFFSVTKPKQTVQPKAFDFSTGGPNLPITSSKEEKDLMEIFATIFIHIDPASFNEIVSAELPFLFDSMLDNAALLHLPQFFLASEITSSNFSGILISFLRSRLDQLDKVDLIKSNILIRLFKLCFMSVNLFPAANESVILPHLKFLILESLRLATEAEEPVLYSYLVRTLFRSISGGRFENLYKEIMPILPVLLETLNKLIANSRRPYERDIYVELCLTVPVRLSVLVPHLNYLTTPLVHALNGSQELVSQGLRTFELCVDNLTAEYFDPMIEPVIDEIMAALWKHLEPVPYHHQHSHTAIRILGKLGGRNHKHMKPCKDLKPQSELDQEVKALFTIHGFKDRVPLSITPGVESAIKLIEDPRLKAHYRISAYNYLSSILKLFIDTTPIPPDYALYIQEQVEVLKMDQLTEIPELEPSGIQDAAKLDNQQKLFSRLLEVLFFSLSIPEIKDEASTLIDNITNHFTLLHLGTSVIGKIKKDRPFSVKDQEGKAYISETVFFNALNYALSFWDRSVREKGVETIKNIHKTAVVLFGSETDVLCSPLFRAMFYKFTHCCYSEYYHSKLGGVLGLKTMLEDLNIPPQWFFKRQFELVRSIFFILRDTPDSAPFEVRELAKNLVLKILKECNSNVSEETVSEKPFQTLVGALVYDLASAVPIVREVSQKSLKVLSDATGVPIATIIGPSKHLLLTPIFGKPLRALPFPMQIGNIDAITYCLGLENSFLTFNDELNRLLLEALALVDAEDESLANVHRLYEHRTSKQLIELRVVCIRLLSMALVMPGFSLGSLSEARIRILGVFFKALCNKSTEIIKAAHQGLKSSLDESAKLPKELLQNGLRPMLMNLSDHKKLTVSGLEALARLLELLISYFRVEIGRKLLDHLMAWAQINTLRQIAGQDLENNHTVQIVMAILNIFHLLPAKAYTFMEEIINTLQYLEGHLDRHQNSPFRTPVLKFLNRFPENCLEYYLSHFKNRKLGNMLAYFAGAENGPKIREVAKQKMDGIITDLQNEASNEILVIKFANTVDLIAAISNYDKEWFAEQAPLLRNLSNLTEKIMGVKNQLPLVSTTHLQVDQAVSKLQTIVVRYMEQAPTETDLLFEVINQFSILDIKIHDQVENFIFERVVKSTDVTFKQTYMTRCVEFIASDSHLKAKILLLKRVFDSILLYSTHEYHSVDALFADGPEWLEKLNENIWKSTNDIITDRTSGTIDTYRFALLETTSILLKWAPEQISNYRKDIIKFSWNYIKLEDNITKLVAYVTTSYFIAAYETPSQLATQVFVALLRTHQNDSRHLVRQALDILAPVMSARLVEDEAPNSWLKWPRRVLSEDGFNVTQVLNVYQFINSHPDLFFPAREHFISNIITAMGKLTILANAALENQVLAIDLAELILSWENQVDAMKKNNVSKDTSSTQEPNESASNDFTTSDDYVIPFGQREACVTFLIRYICISPQRASESGLGQKALGILYDLLSPEHWPEVSVKITFFEKFLLSNDLNASNLLGYCLNALEVLGVVLEWKKPEWIISNLGYLQKLLEKCIKSENHDIQEVLQRVLRTILQAINTVHDGEFPEDEDSEMKNFVSLLTTTVSENLSDTTSLAAGVTLSWTLANYRSNTLDPLLPSIMRTFNKLCKDHIGITHQGASRETTANSDEAKITTKLLEKILNLCSMRISSLGDQRRIFLSLLAQLIEKSLDKDTLEKIIKIVKSWVFSRTDLFPTTKEKAAILAKMMIFEIRGEPHLSKEFYQIIVDIFEDDTFSCTELTVRMEQPFLVGTRSSEVSIRRKLMSILNNSLEKDISKRLYYVIREQNWEYLADYPWLNQALQLLFGAFNFDDKLELISSENKVSPLTAFPYKEKDIDVDSTRGDLDTLLKNHNEFLKEISNISAGDVLEPLIDMFYQSSETVHKVWSSIFPIAFESIPRSEYLDFTRFLVILLSKDYHVRQVDTRPNVIQSLLEGVSRCEELQLPPFAVECLASNFNAWSQGIHILEKTEQQSINGSAEVREVTQDALAKLYATLKEDDMFYGLWRRRAKYSETISALSHEQIGMWDKAQQLYETAQIKARSGALPYGQSEYSLWEDHWILCAEKLQHWDILTELAKHEGFSDLLLECGWRVADWNADRETLEQTVKSVMDVPTPRRQVFETFLCLQGFGQEKETLPELSRMCDEGIQLALRKWHSLPQRFGNAHIPLLHTFQQYVEFMEASQVYSSLVSTNAQNLDVKSQELKRVLQVWRERLPNTWDDINIWNDLITWRQHAFQVINKVYMPFIPILQQTNSDGNANSYAYRGFHEIAWVINRFAHVARKHNMSDVCINQLTKIYQLPNIEIQEAFLKLKEQVKCHYQNPNELNTGLDVIRNTNLVYFATQQKAEFFTLKGMFLSKLNQKDEANKAFATSVQIDLNLPKAWAEWGVFNDRRFKENPNDLVYANNAISCYLQAAGLYKNGKTRKLLARILWLICLDDASGTLAQAFENFRGEVPVWYWITFIPQLLNSLYYKEAKLVRQILIRIAKSYPQALHFQLRTTKEDFAAKQRQHMELSRQKNQSSLHTSVDPKDTSGSPESKSGSNGNGSKPEIKVENAEDTSGDKTSADRSSETQNGASSNESKDGQADKQSSTNGEGTNQGKQSVDGKIPASGNIRRSWEYVEEIMGILKTAYPLLALSLESLVDQINQRFKCTADEDAYRLGVALLNDGVQYLNRLGNPREDAKLPPVTEVNITRFAETVLPKQIRAEFEKDLVLEKPNLETYIVKLRKWRDRLEDKLDRRFTEVNLENLCPHLSEFHHQKFEEIEVPGQYLLNKDSNSHFVKIERFSPTIDLARGTNACYKRMKIRGNDGSLHSFAVQFPAARHCRREESLFQLFRIFDDKLSKKVETRRRNISFTLPIAVPLSPHIRIINDDSRDVSMQKIYEDFCFRNGKNRDEPFIYTIEKLRAAFDPRLPKPDVMSIRVEILGAIQTLLVPSTVMKNYFVDLYPNFEDFWLFRKQFTSQYASFIFTTYMMCVNTRQPQKIHVNRGSGNVWTSDMLPCKIASKNASLDGSNGRPAPLFYNAEMVPFRLTPNIQKLIGESGLEGILSVYVLAIAKALTEPRSDLEQYLTLFVRDEVISWFTQQDPPRPIPQDSQLREIVMVNVELIIKRVVSMAQSASGSGVSTQNVLELIAQAVNPHNLAAADTLWMAYF